jgi:hypothetical protein
MSIALMTLAWKSSLPAGQKMVLLALCDNANDQGECYPSITMLAEKCSMTTRSVQRHITDMEVAGIVARDMRNGRSTVYHINPRKFVTPDTLSPPTDCHPTPATVSPPPLTQSRPTPDMVSPITIKEPSVEPKRNRQARPSSADASLILPDWLPLEAWDGYLDMRKKIRKVPTDYALKLVIADLGEFREAGHDVAAILGNSIKNGWTAVYAPKAVPTQPQANGRRMDDVL